MSTSASAPSPEPRPGTSSSEGDVSSAGSVPCFFCHPVPKREFVISRGVVAKVDRGVRARILYAVEKKQFKRAENLIREVCPGAEGAFRDLVAKKQIEGAKDYVSSLKNSRFYCGTDFTVSFRCDRNIILTALGFWGPAQKDCLATYRVNVEISCGKDTICNVSAAVDAKGQEIFAVELTEKQVPRVQRFQECCIKFQLRGPRTCYSDYDSMPWEVVDEESGTRFMFSCYESTQLPRIFYVLDPKPDRRSVSRASLKSS